MNNKKKREHNEFKISQVEKNKFLDEINQITLTEDLSNLKTVNKINKLKTKITALDETLTGSEKLSNISTKEGEYYQTMSATYIDDSGEISEVYRINDEIVTKEIYDEWSYDYFHDIKLIREKQEEEKLRNDILALEEELNLKKDLFLKKTKPSVSMKFSDIRTSRSSQDNNIFKKNFTSKKR